MIFTVSVFKRGKSGPVLTKVEEVLADRFVADDSISGIEFYNDNKSWRGKVTSTLVAFFPDHDWVIKAM